MLASGDDVNVWVLDTEGCNNTGAQTSKAKLTGAAMKMAAGGNSAKKKDLSAIAMTLESAYLASAALSADVGQTVGAFRAAEAYKDLSIIDACATCVDWDHRAVDKAMVREQCRRSRAATGLSIATTPRRWARMAAAASSPSTSASPSRPCLPS